MAGAQLLAPDDGMPGYLESQDRRELIDAAVVDAKFIDTDNAMFSRSEITLEQPDSIAPTCQAMVEIDGLLVTVGNSANTSSLRYQLLLTLL